MLINILLIIVLVICFLTDLREQKIYNKVIFPSLIIAIILHTIFYGYSGLKLSLLGFLVGFCILLVPYLLGGIGAGDVKLLALIGAIKGSIFVLNTALYMGLLGGAIAVAIIIWHKETINFIKGLLLWIASFFYGTRYKPEFSTTVMLKKYPYGVAITAGAAICLIFKGAWII
jgi:prepilin peptidase CpaA